jgi:hypothetical protein
MLPGERSPQKRLLRQTAKLSTVCLTGCVSRLITAWLTVFRPPCDNYRATGTSSSVADCVARDAAVDT